MHVHIATCGKETEHVISCLKAIPEATDFVHILSSKKFSEESAKLSERLKNFGYECEINQISGFDFYEIEGLINSIFKKYKSKDKNTSFSINITGGTNLMAAAACSSSLYTNSNVYYMMYDPNNKDQPLSERVVSIKMTKLPDISQYGKKTLQTLKYLYDNTKNGETLSNKEIAIGMNYDPNVAKYHLSLLNKGDLITHEPDKRDKKSMDNQINRKGIMFVEWWL